jgi:single-strand DNA-binding protein
MASTARRYDSATQQFVDAGTLWIDVECWNGLSSNVSGSVSKGDPVVVHGALSTHSWESENGRRSAPRIRAFAVGPNLAKGTAVFKRDKPLRSAEPNTSGSLSPAGEAAGEDVRPGDLVAGRDYEVGEETLHQQTSTDLAMQPAHV